MRPDDLIVDVTIAYAIRIFVGIAVLHMQYLQIPGVIQARCQPFYRIIKILNEDSNV